MLAFISALDGSGKLPKNGYDYHLQISLTGTELY